MLTFPTCNPVKRIDFILLRCVEGTAAAGISTSTSEARSWGLSKAEKEKIKAAGGSITGVQVDSIKLLGKKPAPGTEQNEVRK